MIRTRPYFETFDIEYVNLHNDIDFKVDNFKDVISDHHFLQDVIYYLN